jgi:hypothetical protein
MWPCGGWKNARGSAPVTCREPCAPLGLRFAPCAARSSAGMLHQRLRVPERMAPSDDLQGHSLAVGGSHRETRIHHARGGPPSESGSGNDVRADRGGDARMSPDRPSPGSRKVWKPGYGTIPSRSATNRAITVRKGGEGLGSPWVFRDSPELPGIGSWSYIDHSEFRK